MPLVVHVPAGTATVVSTGLGIRLPALPWYAGIGCVLLVLQWRCRSGSKAMALKMGTGGVAGPSLVLLTIGIRVLQDVLGGRLVTRGACHIIFLRT